MNRNVQQKVQASAQEIHKESGTLISETTRPKTATQKKEETPLIKITESTQKKKKKTIQDAHQEIKRNKEQDDERNKRSARADSYLLNVQKEYKQELNVVTNTAPILPANYSELLNKVQKLMEKVQQKKQKEYQRQFKQHLELQLKLVQDQHLTMMTMMKKSFEEEARKELNKDDEQINLPQQQTILGVNMEPSIAKQTELEEENEFTIDADLELSQEEAKAILNVQAWSLAKIANIQKQGFDEIYYLPNHILFKIAQGISLKTYRSKGSNQFKMLLSSHQHYLHQPGEGKINLIPPESTAAEKNEHTKQQANFKKINIKSLASTPTEDAVEHLMRSTNLTTINDDGRTIKEAIECFLIYQINTKFMIEQLSKEERDNFYAHSGLKKKILIPGDLTHRHSKNYKCLKITDYQQIRTKMKAFVNEEIKNLLKDWKRAMIIYQVAFGESLSTNLPIKLLLEDKRISSLHELSSAATGVAGDWSIRTILASDLDSVTSERYSVYSLASSINVGTDGGGGGAPFHHGIFCDRSRPPKVDDKRRRSSSRSKSAASSSKQQKLSGKLKHQPRRQLSSSKKSKSLSKHKKRAVPKKTKDDEGASDEDAEVEEHEHNDNEDDNDEDEEFEEEDKKGEIDDEEDEEEEKGNDDEEEDEKELEEYYEDDEEKSDEEKSEEEIKRKIKAKRGKKELKKKKFQQKESKKQLRLKKIKTTKTPMSVIEEFTKVLRRENELQPQHFEETEEKEPTSINFLLQKVTDENLKRVVQFVHKKHKIIGDVKPNIIHDDVVQRGRQVTDELESFREKILKIQGKYMKALQDLTKEINFVNYSINKMPEYSKNVEKMEVQFLEKDFEKPIPKNLRFTDIEVPQLEEGYQHTLKRAKKIEESEKEINELKQQIQTYQQQITTLQSKINDHNQKIATADSIKQQQMDEEQKDTQAQKIQNMIIYAACVICKSYNKNSYTVFCRCEHHVCTECRQYDFQEHQTPKSLLQEPQPMKPVKYFYCPIQDCALEHTADEMSDLTFSGSPDYKE